MGQLPLFTVDNADAQQSAPDPLTLLRNGAVHNPDTYRELCRIEAVTGYSFRQGFWLSDLRPDLLPREMMDAVREHQRAGSAPIALNQI